MAELCFNVEGEFITNLARSMFYQERKPYKQVEQLLLSCMYGTNIPLETLKSYVEDILKFKKKFSGDTKNNTFCLTDENEPIPDYIKVKSEDFINAYFSSLRNIKTKDFYEYGFINPSGIFFPVAWCEHQKWAYDYLNEKYTIEEQMKKSQAGKYVGADCLVYVEGWILLHNARQETAEAEIGKPMTKQQKETLFDYYMYYGREKEAINLFKED